MFITTPYLDTPKDDDKLLTFYKKYRKREIETSHAEYPRLMELKDLMDEELNKNRYVYTTHYIELEDEYKAIHKRIVDAVVDTLSKEIESEEDNVFPICMADRMKMLFGEECHKLYKYILENFEE